MNVQPVIRIVMVQAGVTMVMVCAGMVSGVVAGSSISEGWVWAYSGLAGGLTCLLPGLYSGFRLRVGQHVVQTSGSQDASIVARRAVIQLLTAEAGKWALTVGLMLLTFRFVQPLNGWWYFGALVSTYGAYVLVPYTQYRRQRV